jgi:hypothetical protein
MNAVLSVKAKTLFLCRAAGLIALTQPGVVVAHSHGNAPAQLSRAITTGAIAVRDNRPLSFVAVENPADAWWRQRARLDNLFL